MHEKTFWKHDIFFIMACAIALLKCLPVHKEAAATRRMHGAHAAGIALQSTMNKTDQETNP